MRGFQVAPAELEGCILDHRDVSDACVVGVPDEYSGELPLAFVVLRSDAVSRMEGDPSAAERIKASIMKVRVISFAKLAVAEAMWTARCGQQGWIQEVGGGSGVCGGYPEESERKVA